MTLERIGACAVDAVFKCAHSAPGYSVPESHGVDTPQISDAREESALSEENGAMDQVKRPPCAVQASKRCTKPLRLGQQCVVSHLDVIQKDGACRGAPQSELVLDGGCRQTFCSLY